MNKLDKLSVFINNIQIIKINRSFRSQEVGYYDAYSTSRALTSQTTGQQAYQQRIITSPSLTGTHNYEIKKTGTNEWTIWIDGVARLTLEGYYHKQAANHTVGDENW